LRSSQRIKTAVLLASLSCAEVPLGAHHSFTAEYDVNKRVTVKGTVSKIEWINPHAHIYVDVSGPSGKMTTWNIELAASRALTRLGWTAATIKIGDTVTVEGDLARSRINGAHARTVILADGTRKQV
jgi:hypothetical protein